MSVPPPPPPPLPVVELQKLKLEPVSKALQPRQEVRKLTSQLGKRLNLNADARMISTYRPVPAQLQDGPMCGLVALSIATHSATPVDVAEIFSKAKARGFTKQGEMFSVEEMSALSEEVFPPAVKVETVQGDSEYMGKNIIDHLTRGHLALIPYDADGNHEPCLKRGHKAHWALLTGCVCVLAGDEVELLQPLNQYDPDEELTWLYHTKTPPEPHPPLQFPSAVYYVYAKQGKSRHTALWSLTALLDSNVNLEEPDPKIAADPEAWHLPAAGLQAALSRRTVLLFI